MQTVSASARDLTEPAMPRAQGGSSPQHLLVTLLGDYWIRHERDLPSAGLIDLLAEFGVTRPSARAALSRLLRRGLVEVRRAGRQTFYRLSDHAAERMAEGGRRIASFGLDSDWDGRWTIVAFSIPEHRRESRHLLRSRLSWFGFAPLYDAVWVSATSTAADARAVLTSLDVSTATVFTATADTTVDRSPLSAWDLERLAAVYTSFIDETRPLLEAVLAGTVTPRQALIARTRLMDTYRRFPGTDPGLPSAHMPAGWPRDQARSLFTEVYNALGPLAESRVKQIMGAHDAEAAARARFQSVDQLCAAPDRRPEDGPGNRTRR
ncbi:PaaX family transcriptional regulator [Streptomyces sp. S465]|uniref:PaaX family transcriptional regulator n=1 Tax=Streptomyces sp. S465 TaxID=2979468 RepID=UPI0022A8876B|nr:PaaX family transcriptional regulator C-terminal domain-containing protein [Streptomyces sp. S465]WAP53572.1 GntR family transcriptional regulator [Streptomyces sp. S465]